MAARLVASARPVVPWPVRSAVWLMGDGALRLGSSFGTGGRSRQRAQHARGMSARTLVPCAARLERRSTSSTILDG